MLLVLSGMTRSSLTPIILPRPPQVGQAPRGLLKLNMYSSGRLKVIPSSSKRFTKVRSSPSRETSIVPSPREKAVSTDESMRVRRSGSGSPPSSFILSTSR